MARAMAGRGTRGVTLTELLVVISIFVILMAIFVPALGTFAHTSRVIAAADTVAVALREARYHAMSNNVPVVPLILRDRKGRFTITYARKALNFSGTLSSAQTAPINFLAPQNVGWTMLRQSMDAPQLERGAFIYMLGCPYSDLNNPTSYYYPPAELMYVKATRPADPRLVNDSAQYSYVVQMRGVHNTSLRSYVSALGDKTEGFIVVGGMQTDDVVGVTDARDYTLGGFTLPEFIAMDQIPKIDAPGASKEGPVIVTVTAQAALFQEEGMLFSWGGKYPPKDERSVAENYQIFRPIFLSDGRVTMGNHRDTLGGFEAANLDQTLRIFDTYTREALYITLRAANGQVVISKSKPSGIPAYSSLYPPPPPPPPLPPVVSPPPPPSVPPPPASRHTARAAPAAFSTSGTVLAATPAAHRQPRRRREQQQ